MEPRGPVLDHRSSRSTAWLRSSASRSARVFSPMHSNPSSLSLSPPVHTCERVGAQIRSLGRATGGLACGFKAAGGAAQDEGKRPGPWLWQGWPWGAATGEGGRHLNRLEDTSASAASLLPPAPYFCASFSLMHAIMSSSPSSSSPPPSTALATAPAAAKRPASPPVALPRLRICAPTRLQVLFGFRPVAQLHRVVPATAREAPGG